MSFLSPFPLLLGNLPTFVRVELTRLLHADPDLGLVGMAAAPDELPGLARRLRPGVVMISEENILVLEQLHRYFPVPVLLYTSRPVLPGMLKEVARLGVYDHITAASAAGVELAEWRRLLKRKLLAARKHFVPSINTPSLGLRSHITPLPPQGIVVIGGSTGGAPAVETVLRSLPANFPWAIVVAVHLPEHFTQTLVARLRKASTLPVAAAANGTLLQAGHVVVAPGGRNLVVRPVLDSPWLGWQTALVNEASFDVPSIDILMHSVVRVSGRNTLGVVLTGLGSDGTLGAGYITQQGGTIIAQDEASSAVFSMPKSVIQSGHASRVLALRDIAAFMVRHTQPASVGRTNRFPSLVKPVQAR